MAMGRGLTNIHRSISLFMAVAVSSAGGQSLSDTDGKWELRGDSTRIVEVDGRRAIQLETGEAYRRDVSLLDGTIDADVKVTNRRSFVYVNFRMQSDEEHEEFYFRPHKSDLPDAAQYSPVYQGQSAWQLYHGSRGTTAVHIEPDQWQHFRIVLSGSRAAFFLRDTIKPFMVIQHLARDPRAGYISIRGYLPAGVPGKGPIAAFANITVRPGVVSYDFNNLPTPPDTRNFHTRNIVTWEVGPAFSAPDTAVLRISPLWLSPMTRVPNEPEGFVQLHRHVLLPKDARVWGVVARASFAAESATIKRFDIGFSDRVTVFLNGRPIFNGDASYDYVARRDGLIDPSQATLYLPLRKGKNEVWVMVTDRFGGWAIMGSIPDVAGVRIPPD